MNMEFLPYLYDGVLLLLVVVIVCLSAHRGFVRTVCLLFGGVIAAVGGGWASDWLRTPVFTTFLKKPLTDTVEKALSRGGAAADPISALPRFLSLLTEGFFGSKEEAAFQVELASRSAAEGIVESALRPAVESLIGVVIFLIVFALLCLLVWFLSRALMLVDHLPVVSTLNHFLGGVFGLLQAMIVILIAAAILRLVILLSGDGISWLNTELIGKTKILNIFYTLHLFVGGSVGVS